MATAKKITFAIALFVFLIITIASAVSGAVGDHTTMELYELETDGSSTGNDGSDTIENGTISYITAIINDGADLQGENAEYFRNSTFNSTGNVTKIRTFDFWASSNSSTGHRAFFSLYDNTEIQDVWFYFGCSDGDQFDLAGEHDGPTTKWVEITAAGCGIFPLSHFVILLGTGGLEVYLNGSLLMSDATTDVLDEGLNVFDIGHEDTFRGIHIYGNTTIDNFRISDSRYTGPEINESYNAGAGYDFGTPATQPSINISETYPTSGAILYNDITYNATVNLSVPSDTNCSIWINDTEVYQLAGSLVGTVEENLTYTQTEILGDVKYKWGCEDNTTSVNTTEVTIRVIEDYNITAGYETTLYRVGQNVTMQCNHSNPNVYTNDTTYYVNNTVDDLIINQTNAEYTILSTDLFDNLTYFCGVNGTYLNKTSTPINISGQPDMLVNITVIDTSGTWITDILTIFTDRLVNYTTNPFYFLASNYINSTTRQINVSTNTTDLNGGNQPLLFNLTLNDTNQNVNMTMQPNQLTLSFVQNGSAITVNGYVSDLNKSHNFSNSSLVVVQSGLEQGPVHVRWVMTDWQNATQFYDYENNYSTISETLEVLQTADWYAYVRVLDFRNSPLKDVKIRAYSSYHAQNNGSWVYHGLIGQRLTEDDGYTFFWHDQRTEVVYEIEKDGYQSIKLLLTIGDESFTRTSPLIIRLNPEPVNITSNVWAYVPTTIRNKTSNILGYLTAIDYNKIEVQTNYSQDQGFGRYDITPYGDSLDRYPFTLTSGTDFDPLTNDNITLNIFLDGSYSTSINITYDPDNLTSYLGPTITNSRIWNPLLYISLILIAVLIGGLLKSASASKTAFKLGAIVLCFIQPMFIWIGAIFGLEYLLKIVRRFIAE